MHSDPHEIFLEPGVFYITVFGIFHFLGADTERKKKNSLKNDSHGLTGKLLGIK